MFARPTFGNFFQPQPFTAGYGPAVGQYGQLSTAHLTNPIIAAHLAPVNPQLQVPIGGPGINPLAAMAMIGANPFLSPQYAAGLPPAINPLVASQLAINPSLLPNLVPQFLGGGYGVQPQFGAFGFGAQPQQVGGFGIQPQLGTFNPLLGQMQLPIGNEAGHFGYTPFGIQPGWQGLQQTLGNVSQWITPYNSQLNPFGQLTPGVHPQQAFGANLASPYFAQDPSINASLFQHRMPIRSLVNPQSIDPLQFGISGMSGVGGQSLTDPYLSLNQAYLAQFGISPLQQQQMAGGYASNWTGSPYSTGQVSPLAQG